MPRHIARLLAALAAALLLAAPPAQPAVAATFPAEFQDSLVTSVTGPTALAFLPDGRLLITTQAGVLRVYKNGALLAAPALNLSDAGTSQVCTESERGLLGVTVDPQFATNGYIYLFYTRKTGAACPTNSDGEPLNRVSRFTMTSDTASEASEVVLVDNMPSPNGNHNAGDLHIGKDGKLYISIGDGGCDYNANSGCGGGNDAARDKNVLTGKILRVNLDGTVPADNPWVGQAGARRCGNIAVGPGGPCTETFAWGLRNPFRMGFDPDAAGVRFFINDVGQGALEEINLGQAGADYGWNLCEGTRTNNNSGVDCSPPPAGITGPIFEYNRSQSCSSITGGAFVPQDSGWPADYLGTYLYSDYVCGRIFRLTQSGQTYTSSSFATDLGNSSAVDMIFGPLENGTRSLYYTTYAGGGQVVKVEPPATGNTAPVARISAAPLSTAATTLLVNFDGGDSSDANGDPLTYAWSFGDGASGTGVTTSHTYSGAGTYTATLTVSDGRGGVSTPASVRIDVGNTPPTPTIELPANGATFAVGQVLTLRGNADDVQDTAAPSLSWEVLLHHDAHTHPYLSGDGPELTLTAPAPEDVAAAETSYLEVRLTATDSSGLSTTVSREVRPRKVQVTLASQPTGMRLQVNGVLLTTPATFTSWEGWGLAVQGLTLPGPGGQWYELTSWQHGGAPAQTIVTPAADTTYTAVFEPTNVSVLTTVFGR